MPHKEKPRMWKLRQDAGRPGVLKLYIYSDVEADWWSWYDGWQESETSAEFFRKELADYPNVNEIEIYINSRGGDVFEGTAIYNQLRRHPAHKTVYVDGFACSIASVIAMAGDEVVMPRNTMMMLHNMSRGYYGSAAELRKAADDLDRINAAGRQAYLVKAGDRLDEAKLIEMMDAETWLTAEECIAFGLANRYADKDVDLSEARRVLEASNARMEQSLDRHRTLTAQLKALRSPEPAPAPTPPPAPNVNPQPPRLMELLAKK